MDDREFKPGISIPRTRQERRAARQTRRDSFDFEMLDPIALVGIDVTNHQFGAKTHDTE